jgi:hypothetical protein
VRDPGGIVSFDGMKVIRSIHEPLPSGHFLYSEVAQELVKKRALVQYEIISRCKVSSDRIPFVTYPTEWSPSQLFDAAKLTLSLQSDANASGFDLKDASAWNVVFNGTHPLFVDLLSFDTLSDRNWPAFGQFLQHFVFPLLLYKHRSLLPNECFQVWRDGVPLDRVARLVGMRRFATRYWPLMIGLQGAVSDITVHRKAVEIEEVKRFRARLLTTLSSLLDGVDPRQRENATFWQNYRNERPHYKQAEISFKSLTVHKWLERTKPSSVLDMGGNSGEFSLMAVSIGARALCWDSDVGAIERLYRENADAVHLHPILGPIDSLHGGYGWSGNEFNGLIQRLNGSIDTVLMLAIIHHIAIACAVRLDDIFGMIKKISAKNIICEFLDVSDQRVIDLCRQYRRDVSEFSIEKQKQAALTAGYKIVELAKQANDSSRELALLSAEV